MNPSVSVVIPVRDDARALKQCLIQLALQTVQPLEVVVVDHASSDGSAALARNFGARVVREPSVGVPAAAAAGYDVAAGDVIARLDADSRPGPGWVALISRRMRDPRLDALSGVGTFYDLPPGVASLTSLAYLGSYYLLAHLALGHTRLWGSSMALRRSTWEAVRDQVHRGDHELSDDLDLAFVLGPDRRIRLEPMLWVGISARSVRGRAPWHRGSRRTRTPISGCG